MADQKLPISLKIVEIAQIFLRTSLKKDKLDFYLKHVKTNISTQFL